MRRSPTQESHAREMVWLIVLLLAVMTGCSQIDDANGAQIQACFAGLGQKFDEGRVYPAKIPSGDNWSHLTDADADVFLGALANGQRVSECGRWTGSRPLLDPWDHRVLVKVRRHRNGGLGLHLSSRGPDAIQGTLDDVVSVFEPLQRGGAPPAGPPEP